MATKKDAVKKDAVAKKQSTELAVHEYGEDVGSGFENQTSADLAIPFLNLLQPLSPEVVEDGMKAGTFVNSVSGDNLGEEVIFVPATTDRCFVEWTPREQGGGFVARHEVGSAVIGNCSAHPIKGGVLVTPDGNDLIETFYVYGVDGDGLPLVVAFNSTKIKVYRKWQARLRMHLIATPSGKINPPLFANKSLITSEKLKNEKGTFFNFIISGAVDGDLGKSLLATDDELYTSAKGIGAMIAAGTATASYETQENAGGSSSNDGEGAF